MMIVRVVRQNEDKNIMEIVKTGMEVYQDVIDVIYVRLNKINLVFKTGKIKSIKLDNGQWTRGGCRSSPAKSLFAF